jgi:hypothetical protein
MTSAHRDLNGSIGSNATPSCHAPHHAHQELARHYHDLATTSAHVQHHGGGNAHLFDWPRPPRCTVCLAAPSVSSSVSPLAFLWVSTPGQP